MSKSRTNQFEVSAESMKVVPARVEWLTWPMAMIAALASMAAYIWFTAYVTGPLSGEALKPFSPVLNHVREVFGKTYAGILARTIICIAGTALAFLPLPLIAVLTRDRAKMLFIALFCVGPILLIGLFSRGLPVTATDWVLLMEPINTFLLFTAFAFKVTRR